MSTEFSSPFTVQVEMDDEPIFIVDANEEIIVEMNRSSDPKKDIEAAEAMCEILNETYESR